MAASWRCGQRHNDGCDPAVSKIRQRWHRKHFISSRVMTDVGAPAWRPPAAERQDAGSTASSWRATSSTRTAAASRPTSTSYPSASSPWATRRAPLAGPSGLSCARSTASLSPARHARERCMHAGTLLPRSLRKSTLNLCLSTGRRVHPRLRQPQRREVAAVRAEGELPGYSSAAAGRSAAPTEAASHAGEGEGAATVPEAAEAAFSWGSAL